MVEINAWVGRHVPAARIHSAIAWAGALQEQSLGPVTIRPADAINRIVDDLFADPMAFFATAYGQPGGPASTDKSACDK